MTTITLKGNECHTNGEIPSVGQKVTDFTLVQQDLSEVSLSRYKGKKKVLNIFPSVDTGVCATSVKMFYEKVGQKEDTVLLNISKDLPFALSRFCSSEGIKNAETLSAFRSSFAKDFGLEIIDGSLVGLCSRVVIVLDADNNVIHSEQVPEITQEPNYDQVLEVLN